MEDQRTKVTDPVQSREDKKAMPASRKAVESTAIEKRDRFAGLIATEREVLAKRIADAPAAWMSIAMWGRVFTTGRKLLGLDRLAGRR